MTYDTKLSRSIYNSRWYRRYCREKGSIRESLVLLYPGTPAEKSEEDFHLRKITEFLLGMVLVFLIALLGMGTWIVRQRSAGITYLDRPGYDAADTTDRIVVCTEDGSRYVLSIDVGAREYTTEQEKELLNQASDYLDKVILGENETADRIDHSLVLPDECLNGSVLITWTTNHPSVLSSDGRIKESHMDEEGTIVRVKGTMECEDSEAIYSRDFVVYPQAHEEAPEYAAILQNALTDVEAKSREDELFYLPDTLAGEAVTYREPVHSDLLFLSILLFVGVIMLAMIKDEKLKEQVRKREEELLADYPELVSKLNILLGAGLTPRLAFARITADYRRKRSVSGKRRYAYEEVSMAYYEMMNGVAEPQAYEKFGKRCGILPYLRLGGMLSAGTRQGNKELARILENEAREAFDERKRHAKELGEKAGTKLLLPMVMMLMVTILLIIYPAFVSFQI